MDLSTSGQLVITLIGCGALVGAVLLNLVPMRTTVRAALAIGVPVSLFGAFLIANPEASCQSDCLQRASWGVITTVAAVGWIAGFATFALLRRITQRPR